MVDTAWRGLDSAVAAGLQQWNDAPTRRPMHASSIGIIAEYSNEMIPVSGMAMEGAVPIAWLLKNDQRHRTSSLPTSPYGSKRASSLPYPLNAESLARKLKDTDLRASDLVRSPQRAGQSKVASPRKVSSPTTPSGLQSILHTDEDRSFLMRPDPGPSWRQLPSIEARRTRRSRLLRAAERDRGRQSPIGSPDDLRMEPVIPLYDNLEVYQLVPRRKVEFVEGTLYDPEGPFMEGAVSDSLSVRLFYAPAPDNSECEGVSYLITTPDNRVFSSAKRRRWAMDNHGNFFAALEMKSIESKLIAVHQDLSDPVHVEDFEQDLRRYFVQDVLDELQKAETLVPGVRVSPHLLQTEDGKLIRLEQDFPEEAFFAIAGCTDDEVYPVIAKVFVEAIHLLWDLHSHGWMHGDVKLENLMFTQSGKLIMIDFENASPFRGTRQHDGKIQLLSFDWTPPELEVSYLGRRMGPSGDLWALGCNLIRAFALRDGIEDETVREMLLGGGTQAFFKFRQSLLTGPASDFGIDLELLYACADQEQPAPLVYPARMLRRFAKEAPRLLQYILRYSVAPTPAERNERIGVQLAQEMLHDPQNTSLWTQVKVALDHSIAMSGSTWVRPKLEEARGILGLS
ncbi:hypothetical protein MYAM1_002615 [Malassezia yamatoensis]|uniref:Protein kinase domain-containing protein n=1 Tax=Malassezia yamatoensis TaxID=253288 RepID=A0AAJ6CHG7_9BASI|nr:hypothetical protein MYAM1_002615 [Malassezia yamatoensis]